MSKEIQIIQFDDLSDYTRYLHQRNHMFYTPCAKGIIYHDGRKEAIIYPKFYLQAGIPAEYLDAILKHEEIELASEGEDKHFYACVGEYQLIVERFGKEALKDYHGRLGKLMGPDEARTKAFYRCLEAPDDSHL